MNKNKLILYNNISSFTMQICRIMNNAVKDKQYEDPELNDGHIYSETADKLSKLRVDVTDPTIPVRLNNPMQFVISKPSGEEDGNLSPTFGGAQNNNTNLGVDDVKPADWSKREKVAGNDGKSHHKFIEINKHN